MSAADAKIPMIDLAAQHAPLEEELLEGLAAVLASGRFVLGEVVERFEAELAALCEARFAVACNSGTDALWIALRALGVGPGDRVLCPAYSFFATASTLVRLGAVPVFCDILPGSLNLDPEDAIRRGEATPGLRAVVPVDLFGRACELGPLEAWCRARGVAIVDDAAQAIGTRDRQGGALGARGRAACLSFYPTKNLGALGDAGALLTDDEGMAATARRLRSHGEAEPGVFREIGLNSRMDALQAVALGLKLRHLEDWTRARRRLALHYDALFAERGARPSPLPFDGEGLPLRTPEPCPEPGRHTYHRYVIRVPAERRASLIGRLEAEGIACEIYYRLGLHQQPALAGYFPATSTGSEGAAARAPLVETERATRETLALPLFPEMRLEQVERVVGVVARALRD
ncbi:MAG: DegT/DnrJ/EryC1/StrS family aminotransferase [Myxococcales bacterium]|nr:DegT/DnrJ/EryC1/StrS family aminotransferase [Myxococcales bacterium]